MIVRILKMLGIYTPVKRLKDSLVSSWRGNSHLDKKMAHMYKNFIKKGDLAFDLGASYGNRTKIFLELGARKVITVEPTSCSQNKLRRRYGKNKRVVLLKAGISDKKGRQEITVCSDPAFSTFEKGELEDAKKNPVLKNLEWTEKEEIGMVSLNDLIEKYGLPNFVKLDIEGYESKAFSTLKYAIPSLSFEYHTNFKDKAMKCVDYLSKLGDYEFNYARGETMKFASEKWCNSKKIKEYIQRIDSDNFGDIYCRLRREK